MSNTTQSPHQTEHDANARGTTPNTTGLLAGVRVLEIGHFIAGPFCSRLLGDLGADVIKVEATGTGDPIRGWGEQHEGKSIWWSVHARNKQSITLNLKDERAIAIALKLTSQADILVENFKPGQLDRWGLTEERLTKARPGLVIVRVSGYGQTGPQATRASFGVIGEAIGGIRKLTSFPDGMSELPPARTGISIGDSLAGLYGALGAVAALRTQEQRPQTKPHVVDVALTESVFSLLEGCLPEYGLLDKVRQPSGSTLANNAPSNAYRCADDEWVLIAANSDPLFAKLANTMGAPELLDDPRYTNNLNRCANVAELDQRITLWTRQHTCTEAVEKLNANDIPCTKIYDMADCVADPQFKARGTVQVVDDPQLGSMLHPAPMPRMADDNANAPIRNAGPAVGEHTDAILKQLGYTSDEIEHFRKDGVI